MVVRHCDRFEGGRSDVGRESERPYVRTRIELAREEVGVCRGEVFADVVAFFEFGSCADFEDLGAEVLVTSVPCVEIWVTVS